MFENTTYFLNGKHRTQYRYKKGSRNIAKDVSVVLVRSLNSSVKCYKNDYVKILDIEFRRTKVVLQRSSRDNLYTLQNLLDEVPTAFIDLVKENENVLINKFLSAVKLTETHTHLVKIIQKYYENKAHVKEGGNLTDLLVKRCQIIWLTPPFLGIT